MAHVKKMPPREFLKEKTTKLLKLLKVKTADWNDHFQTTEVDSLFRGIEFYVIINYASKKRQFVYVRRNKDLVIEGMIELQFLKSNAKSRLMKLVKMAKIMKSRDK